jgi:hypothetical protein
MATEKQIAANKLNAQKSTGPKTESGKATSAGNALKHGITAKKYLRPDEDPAEVEAIYRDLCEVHQPEDSFMEDLVLKVAMNHYRMTRAFRAEAEHSPLSSMLLGDHDDRVKNLGAYSAMIRKDLNYLEQALAEHKERRAALKSPMPAAAEVHRHETVREGMPAAASDPASMPPGKDSSG